MSRALVLGGGGPIGIAWESGVIAGLEECGVPVSQADLLVGTSAGSVVGAHLALGRAPRDLYAAQVRDAEGVDAPPVVVDMAALIGQFMKLFTSDRPQQELRAELGAFALAAQTVGEERWLAGFASVEPLGGPAWPQRRFACTAVDTADGAFVVWDNDSRVSLLRAVASSCAVPGVFPPVTINGRRYMDGGVRSPTNADLARGHDAVLVLAVTAGESLMSPDIAAAARQRFESELDELRRSGGRVEVITPGEEFTRTFGLNLMDFTRRPQAAELGLVQGRAEAGRLLEFWG